MSDAPITTLDRLADRVVRGEPGTLYVGVLPADTPHDPPPTALHLSVDAAPGLESPGVYSAARNRRGGVTYAKLWPTDPE